MKRIVIFLIGIVASGTVIAQKIDDQRMNRDLEVARNILSTLIKTEAGGMFGGESIEASLRGGLRRHLHHSPAYGLFQGLWADDRHG
jgi:hypothetical protein